MSALLLTLLWLGSGGSLAVGAPSVFHVQPCQLQLSVVDELDDLQRDLQDSDARTRRKAVQGLRALGSVAAWELLVGALADGDAMVADEAQIALGAASDAERVAVLMGKAGLKSRKELVRLRALEALGRSEASVDVKTLAKSLGAKEARLRRATLWSLERLARSGKLAGDIEKALGKQLTRMIEKDKDAGVRAAAIVALAAALPEQAVAQWKDRGRDQWDGLQLAAALRAMHELVGDFSPMLRRTLGDEDARVRRVALELLAAKPDKAIALALAERLEDEKELRLRWSLVQSLQQFSGLRHAADSRPWRAWAQGLEEDWRPASSTPESKAELGDQSSAFAGLTLLSDRITFLVDFSGSLWQERDGQTRKQVADRELRRALESLPKHAFFNVIPYTAEPDPWMKKLVPATPKNVQRALAAFEKNHAQGKGNFWGALELALEDPAVDTIIVLTDGAPTGGERWNVQLMIELFTERNRFRRVVLEAALIDCRGRLHGFWEELCGSSGGRVVDLKL